MGRFYNGDIEGKFWFAVQSSDDADFFGGSCALSYAFEEDDLPYVKKGIAKCKKTLGIKKVKLDKFFEKHNGYNNAMLVDEGIAKDMAEALSVLQWYARLELGEKIAESIKTNGQCYFEAEL